MITLEINEKETKLCVLEEMKQSNYTPSKNQSSSKKPPYVRKIRTALANMETPWWSKDYIDTSKLS